MKKNKKSLLDNKLNNGIVTPQKPLIDIQFPNEINSNQKLTNGAKEVLKEFKQEVGEILKKTSNKKIRKKQEPPSAEYYTREDIAAIMKVQVKTVARQIKENKIPGRQMFAHKWYIHKQTFDKWLLRKRQIEFRAHKKK